MTDQAKARDLILAPNEFCFVSDATKGHVNVYVGPHKSSLADTDQPVIFSPQSKRFQAKVLNEAVQLFQIAPEGWYIVLKNPGNTNEQPKVGAVSNMQELNIGRKVNIPGPVSFPLWPGQMAQVRQGHHLRSNQYLVARVYDVDSAKKNWEEAVITPQTDVDGKPVKGDAKPVAMPRPKLTMGKLLVIKGTDVSFYIPPTGIEVVEESISVSNDRQGIYVRGAVTLERLEYCILIDENGNKRFERGPAVVFPKPTEGFHERKDKQGRKTRKFRAIELNEQMGLYIKVIADHTEIDGKTKRKAGDELFITGKDTKIYFPREEHAIVKYDHNEINYAITIPAGEARYVLNKDTGSIDLVAGPKMFLADPRTQVIVRRVLDPKVVELMYPGNVEAIQHNANLSKIEEGVGAVAMAAHGMRLDDISARGVETNALYSASTSGVIGRQRASKGFAGDGFRRNDEYTPPRTIQLDNKYDGAVRVGVWTGYAVQIVSTTGERRVVVGPETVLLKYNEITETLELSRGTPKTDNKLKRTVYLRCMNNTVSDELEAETKDRVKVSVVVSYRANFEGDPKRWFDVENYVQFLVEHCRSMIRNSVKMIGIEEFDTNPIGIIRDTILGLSGEDGKRPGRAFKENGMRVYDVEVLHVQIGDERIANLLVQTQHASVQQTLDIVHKEKTLEITKRSEAIVRETEEVKFETSKLVNNIKSARQSQELDLILDTIKGEIEQDHVRRLALLDMQKQLDEINAAEIAREDSRFGMEIKVARERLQVAVADLEARSTAWVAKANAITPKLVEALQGFGDKESAARVAEALGPLTLLGGDSASGILNNVLRGTSLEGVIGTKGNGSALLPPPTGGGNGESKRKQAKRID